MVERSNSKKPSRSEAKHIREQKAAQSRSPDLLESFNALNLKIVKEQDIKRLAELNVQRIWMMEKLKLITALDRVKLLKNLVNSQPDEVTKWLYEEVGHSKDGRQIDRLMQIRNQIFPPRLN